MNHVLIGDSEKPFVINMTAVRNWQRATGKSINFFDGTNLDDGVVMIHEGFKQGQRQAAKHDRTINTDAITIEDVENWIDNDPSVFGKCVKIIDEQLVFFFAAMADMPVEKFRELMAEQIEKANAEGK